MWGQLGQFVLVKVLLSFTYVIFSVWVALDQPLDRKWPDDDLEGGATEEVLQPIETLLLKQMTWTQDQESQSTVSSSLLWSVYNRSWWGSSMESNPVQFSDLFQRVLDSRLHKSDVKQDAQFSDIKESVHTFVHNAFQLVTLCLLSQSHVPEPLSSHPSWTWSDPLAPV